MSVNIYLIQETVDAILLLGAYTCFHFFLLTEIRGSFRYSNIRVSWGSVSSACWTDVLSGRAG